MSLTEKAYQRIRGAIVQGDLAFGEQLSETQIGKILGMSKALGARRLHPPEGQGAGEHCPAIGNLCVLADR